MWPAKGRGYKEIDPSDVDLKALLSRVAREHEAKIEADEVANGITIAVKAVTRARAQQVILLLRDQLLSRHGEEKVWVANLLVSPPKDGGRCLTVVLQSKEESAGRRATAVPTKNLAPANSIDPGATGTEYKKKLLESLDHIAGIVRYIPTGMRMRVQFGTLSLNQWKKDKTEYNLDELNGLVRLAGARATAQMWNA